MSRFSWPCSAEPSQLAPVQLSCTTPRMTTRTRPCSPQDEWRDLKWEFLIGFSAASHRIVRGAASCRDGEAFSMPAGEGSEADRQEGRSKEQKGKRESRERSRAQD